MTVPIAPVMLQLTLDDELQVTQLNLWRADEADVSIVSLELDPSQAQQFFAGRVVLLSVAEAVR